MSGVLTSVVPSMNNDGDDEQETRPKMARGIKDVISKFIIKVH